MFLHLYCVFQNSDQNTVNLQRREICKSVNSSANIRYLESFSTKAQEKKKDQLSILSTTGFVHNSKVGLQFSAASPSGKAPREVMRDKVLI